MTDKEIEEKHERILELIVNITNKLHTEEQFDTPDTIYFFTRGLVASMQAVILTCPKNNRQDIIDIVRDNLCYIDTSIEDFINAIK